MKKLYWFVLFFSFQPLWNKALAQDNYSVELHVGILHNNSLFLGEFLNTGASLGANYYFDRNLFAGLNGTYLMATNPVLFKPHAFNSGLSFPGSEISSNESITRMQVGAVAGYRFFPLRFLSIALGLQLNYLSLERSYDDALPVNEAAVNWIDQSYSSGSVTTPGAFMNVIFNVGRKTSLFLGVQSSDITNSLFDAKDASLIESVTYADGNIASITERKNAYNPLDLRIGVIFKFANRKF